MANIQTLPPAETDIFKIVATIRQLIQRISGNREVLKAARTYYVATTGSNTNDGLSATTPFLTLQNAVDVIVSALDLGGQDVTVQIADGTYAAGFVFNEPWTGGGSVTFLGNTGTPANVVISVGANDAFQINGILGGTLILSGMKIAGGAGVAIYHNGIGGITISSIDFGAFAGGYHIRITGVAAYILAAAGYIISGGTFTHAAVHGNGAYLQVEGSTVTLTGTPAWSGQFLWTKTCSNARFTTTFSGAATGTRYFVELNSTVDVNGAGVNYLPGDVAGSTATGGQYA